MTAVRTGLCVVRDAVPLHSMQLTRQTWGLWCLVEVQLLMEAIFAAVVADPSIPGAGACTPGEIFVNGGGG